MDPIPNFVFHQPNLPNIDPEHRQQENQCFIICDLFRSNRVQKGRIQAVRDMSSYSDVMKEKQMFYTGEKIVISEREFNLIMSQIKNIYLNLLKRISNPPSLRHLTKQAIHIHPHLPIHELPVHLQIEVSNICQDTVSEEVEIINVINVELEKTNSLYNAAFLCNNRPCILM